MLFDQLRANPRPREIADAWRLATRLDQCPDIAFENFVVLLGHTASEKLTDSVANVSRNARRARARSDLVASTEMPNSPASVSRVSPSTYLRVSAMRYCSGRFAIAM